MIVQIRTLSSLPAAFVAVIVAISLATCTLAEADGSTSSSRPQIFRTLEGPWSPCSPINSTLACYRSREVVCVRTTDNATAPWYYCTDIGLERPLSLERCHSSSCPQDCAVSEWTSWTPCNCTAGFFRSRRREIVLPPRNGGKECPSLLEREKCGTCFRDRPFDVLPRSYTWRTGEWGACSNPLDSSADCGHGVQTRTVECVNTEGLVVNSTNCLLQEEAYAHVHPPSTTKLCDIPCPCQFSAWTDWSSCTANCSISPPAGYQKRTRDIIRHATHGGDCSQLLEETRACTLSTNTCPTYSWESSDWSPCQPQDPEATCGTGLTTRFAYCMETRSSDGVSVAVDSSLCDNLDPPNVLALCDIPCRQDCIVGPWSDWSECPKACTPTYSNRTRDVVLPVLAGGAACPHLIEHRACPVLPCVSWAPQPYQACFPSNLSTNCGWGIQSRIISCQDFSGTTLGSNALCLSSLPDPPTTYQDCYKPCLDDCVVSEWSDWSECSETCDGIIGTQSRQRTFAALGTFCPYTEANLTETRNCSNPQPCEPDIYYIIEDPWGLCEEEADASQSSGDPSTLLQFTDSGSSSRCGVGLQNRSAVCMRGDNAIPPEECPISYAPLLKRPCNLPCPSECQYTEWSTYSECSVTCGSGMKTRSRRLLQFSDSFSSNSDCSVDDDGYQRDGMSCENPACPEYLWYLSDYNDCVPFPSVLSQLLSPPTLTGSPCGYGYQNRSVECRHSSSGVIVDDELCLQTGVNRSSEVQSCEVPCQDRCIVTEWSNYSRCDSFDTQTRTRRIIACSRYDPDDWEWCCPELSSLQLTETVACERPSTAGYNLIQTSRYGNCIIDDPDQSCGNGFDYVSYDCVNSAIVGKKFPEEFCPPSSFMTRRSCSIQCDTNCQLGSWSEWGACSTSCGRGNRTRTRKIVRDPDGVGRPCGPLLETDICENSACPYAEYVPGSFSTCTLADSNATCGMGMQTRQAICVIDGQTSSGQECQQLGATITFELSRGCELPCTGECVVSEWGAWSPCPTDCIPGSCQQTRRRDILRGESSRDCLIIENRSCQPEGQRYEWRTQNWTNCILSEIDQSAPNPNHYCGNGTQQRNFDCVDVHSDSTVHDRLCEDLDLQKPAGIQMCSIPCPIDCKVGRFSEWTECPQSCESPVQTRRRQVLIAPMHGGRECPDLEQERPCPPSCTMYVFENDSARCDVDYSRETQCGSALQAKPARCRRNLEFVEVSKCLEAAKQGLSVIGLSSNAVIVDFTNPSYCSVSCPSEPSCTFTALSSPSSCVSLCYDQGNQFLFQTRALIRSFEQHTNRCLAEQYVFSNCPTMEPELNNTISNTTTTALAPLNVDGASECVSFYWQVSEWNSDNTREVWCESGTGIRVNGGCPESLKPSSKRPELLCATIECPRYSTCNSSLGQCQCSEGLEKVAGVCLPLSDCRDDSHCLVPNMECDEEARLCVCSRGYELQSGVCTALPTTAPPPTTSPRTTASPPSTTTAAEVSTSSSSGTTSLATTMPVVPTEGTVTTVTVGTGDTAGLGVLEIVLIGTVPLVIVIVTVLILICITYRCRVYLEKQQYKASKRRRATLSISSPSPLPHTAEEMMNRLSRRGAESASSGFVDDIDNELQKYGMAGKSFIASKNSDDIDEAVFSTPNHGPHPIPVAAPTIPGSTSNPLHHHVPIHDPHHIGVVGESNLDGHMIHPHQQNLPHQHIAPGTPYTMVDYPDGDFTTDVTYTTDEGSIVTTSVPPSSVGGSPNILRRGEEPPPMHNMMPHESPERRSGSQATDNMYVDMQSQPVYASLRRNNHSNYQHHQPPQHVQHHQDYHSHSQPMDYRSVKAYERQSRERLERSHDQSREGSHDYLSEPDYARSLSPCSPTGRYAPTGFPPPHSPSHIPAAGRDNRIATGLDNSMVRAAAAIDDQQGHHSQEEQEFQRSTYHRSSGGRRSHRRRSGRRRARHRHHGDGNPHHMTYHPSSRHDDCYYHHHDDYHRPRVGRHYSEGDREYDPRHDHYYYHSDAQPSPSPHPQYHYQASRSVPMTPIMQTPGESGDHTPHLPPSSHHHHHPPHSPAVIHGQPPHSPAVAQGHPPHSPAVIQGQPHYNSHELQQPNIDIQPPTPATSHRGGDVTPRNSPYVHHQPPNLANQQQLQQVNPEQGGYSSSPSSVYAPQSASTPNLPAHVVPQSTTATTAAGHMTPPVSRDSYDNYDFPRKVHAHYLRQEQLRQSNDMPDTSHYAYPKNVVTANSATSVVPSPAASSYISGDHHHNHQPSVTMGNHIQPQTSTPYSKSNALHSDLSIASSSVANTTYSPHQSVAGDPTYTTTSSPPGSPYVVRRQHHHPSPLVLHSSSSSNSPATSTVYTPRGSAEVQHLSDTGGMPSSSFDSSTMAVAGREQSGSFDGSSSIQQQQHQSQHAQYQINHQVYSGGAPVTPTLQQQQAVQ